jgi:hypothetical protein
MPRYVEIDNREVERFLRTATSPKEELVYRLVLRDLSPRLRTDYNFRQRVNELLKTVPHSEVATLLADAARLEAELLPSGAVS